MPEVEDLFHKMSFKTVAKTFSSSQSSTMVLLLLCVSFFTCARAELRSHRSEAFASVGAICSDGSRDRANCLRTKRTTPKRMLGPLADTACKWCPDEYGPLSLDTGSRSLQDLAARKEKPVFDRNRCVGKAAISCSKPRYFNIQNIFFDFDLTLSATHMDTYLGREDPRNPTASLPRHLYKKGYRPRKPRGEDEFAKEHPESYLPGLIQQLDTEENPGKGEAKRKAIDCIWGGQERVDMLRHKLKVLKDTMGRDRLHQRYDNPPPAGKLHVLSAGKTKDVEAALDLADLRDFFDTVVGKKNSNFDPVDIITKGYESGNKMAYIESGDFDDPAFGVTRALLVDDTLEHPLEGHAACGTMHVPSSAQRDAAWPVTLADGSKPGGGLQGGDMDYLIGMVDAREGQDKKSYFKDLTPKKVEWKIDDGGTNPNSGHWELS